MISILVVDDEYLIRQSILKMLHTHYGTEVNLYEAEHGLKAIELISAVSIDVIISDIKMPICNGIEMLKKLKSISFIGEVLILSGFDDYDLVRDALKLGATDYLLKPIQNSEFFDMLDACTKRAEHRQIYHKRFPAEVFLNNGSLYEQQYNLERLLAGDNAILTAYSSFTNCIIILADIFYQKHLSKGALKKAYFLEAEEQLSVLLRYGCKLIQGEINNLWIIAVFFHDDSNLSSMHEFIDVYKKRQIKVSSSKIFPITKLHAAFEDSIRKLDSCFFDIPNIPPTHPEIFPYSKQFERLTDYVSRFEAVSCFNILHDLFYSINRDRPPVSEIRHILTEFVYTLMQRNSCYIKIISKYKLTENDLVQVIANSFSLSNLRKEFIRILDIYIKDAKESQIQKDEYYIRKAKEYIDKEFRTDINLNALSQYLHIHPNYCCSIFKKKTGMTYLEYLRKVRIKDACRLMDSTNMRLYEIAEAVGYHDTVHLNRAFQKETGQPPSLYKRNS